MDEQTTPGIMERIIHWYFVPGPKPWLSSASIVASSLFMLYGVLVLHWDVFSIMFLYWAENVIIGVFVVLRMSFAGQSQSAALLYIPFFCLTYGLFCLFHGVVVTTLFGGDLFDDPGHPLYSLPEMLFSRHFWDALSSLQTYSSGIVISLLLILVSKGVDFVNRYLIQGEYRTADACKIFEVSYGRIILLQQAVLIGGAVLVNSGSSHEAISLLIVLKMAHDLHLNWRQRATSPGQAVVPGTAPPVINTISAQTQASASEGG